ncbi:MAG: MotA/TolQ/ExbB proton channel family protein [Massilia sp.]|jgi:biopolymer transport protein ExbB|uniref:Biopolymer transport protein ExbB n=1 Tax=Massilia aurea TaxID=373040 RepID=A0A7W9X299_9BURK|nr:MotA/TolQ/ExbB proton channel family protein [Massilia aurea]MBB6135151.1 biopolymer transport protein ExbB [Massilia aurea]MCS0706902.1 MotA/TolQ/ExbB proton channel family protein [Massilia aurea]
MFKNTRLSAFLAAVLLSVTAASALVSAPAFAQTPATDAAAPAATDAAAPAVDPAAAPATDAAATAAPADAGAPAAAPGTEKTEEVYNPYGLQAMWEHGDFVNKGTLIILSLMSIGSWYIIITKLIDQQKVMNQAKDMKAKFWKAPSIVAGSATLKEGSPFRFIAETGTKATQHHDGALLEQIDLSTWVTMQIQRAVDRVQSRLQDGLSFLATVGSTSPFIGLFGTVWGIYNALTAIGMSGNASIDKVAGPVGEALIMTAFGLFVAVPAVLGYNWLVRRNKTALEDIRSFSADVHSVLISGAMSTSNAAISAKKIG